MTQEMRRAASQIEVTGERDDAATEIRRGLSWEIPDGKHGLELARKVVAGTITAQEIVRELEPLGVWWGIESQYGGLSEYEAHAETYDYSVSAKTLLAEHEEEKALVASLDRNVIGKDYAGRPWNSSRKAWEDYVDDLKEQWSKGEGERWFGCSVPVIFTAKRPKWRDGTLWDPSEHNPAELGGLMGNSYLPDGQPLEITEVRYSPDFETYKVLRAGGIRTTAALGTRLWWRVHPEHRGDLLPEMATSLPFFPDPGERPQPGYSCFDDPWHLWLYIWLMWNWDGMKDSGTPVVGFSGTRVGTGNDGEALVMPAEHGTVQTYTVREFFAELLRTPFPPSPVFAPWVRGAAGGHWQTWEKAAQRLAWLDQGDPVHEHIVRTFLPQAKAAKRGRIAGPNGDLPVGLELIHADGRYQNRPTDPDMRWVTATVDGREIGHLGWWASRDMNGWSPHQKGEIFSVLVHEAYQRKGVATAMLAKARSIDPDVHHSSVLTDDGEAWSQKVASAKTKVIVRTFLPQAKAAGLNGDLPDLTYAVHSHYHPTGRFTPGKTWVTAEDHSGKGVGLLCFWNHGELLGEILDVQVADSHRRRGVATELLRRAREIEPKVHHSDNLSDDGISWSQRVASAAPVALPSGVKIEEEWGLPNLLPGERLVSAFLAGRRIGWLVWQGDNEDGRVNVVVVEPEHRRKGIGTALWQAAKALDPNLKHDPSNQTADGRAWAPHAASTTAMPSWRDRGVLPSAECVIAPDLGRGRRDSYMVYLYDQPHARRPTLAEAKETVEEIYGPLDWQRIEGDQDPHPDHVWGWTTMFNDAPYYLIVSRLPRLGALGGTQGSPGAEVLEPQMGSQKAPMVPLCQIDSEHGPEERSASRDRGEVDPRDPRRPDVGPDHRGRDHHPRRDRRRAASQGARPGAVRPPLRVEAAVEVAIGGPLAQVFGEYSSERQQKIRSAVKALKQGKVQPDPKRGPLAGCYTIPVGALSPASTPDRLLLVRAKTGGWLAVFAVVQHNYGPAESTIPMWLASKHAQHVRKQGSMVDVSQNPPATARVAATAPATMWHVTPNRDFVPDPDHQPSGGNGERGIYGKGLFLTPNPELWRYLWATDRPNRVLYAAEIDVSALAPNEFQRLGYDGDDRDQWWVPGPAVPKVKVKRVVPVETAEREAKRRGYGFALMALDVMERTRVCLIDLSKGWGGVEALCGRVTTGDPIKWTTLAETKSGAMSRHVCEDCKSVIGRTAARAVDITPDAPEGWEGAGIYEMDLTGVSTTGCVALMVDAFGMPFPLGWLTWDRHRFTVEGVWVSEDYRNKGIGAELLKEAEGVVGRKLVDSGEYTTEGFAWAQKCGLSPKMKTRISVADMNRMRAQMNTVLAGGGRIKRLLQKV